MHNTHNHSTRLCKPAVNLLMVSGRGIHNGCTPKNNNRRICLVRKLISIV